MSSEANSQRVGWWGGWLGPFQLPRRWTARWVPNFRALGDWLSRNSQPVAAKAPLHGCSMWWPRWLGVAVLLGITPVLLDAAVGVAISHILTPLLCFPLLLAAVAHDRLHPGLTCLGLVYLLHSAAVIMLAATSPALLAAAHPAGAGYWDETFHWLQTGQSRAYDVGAWGPVHFALAAVMAVWSYLSLGLVPLLQGLYELDLMNFYVGRLLAHAREPSPILLLAWHPWSLCRGVGFMFVTFELASLSLARLTGVPLSPVRRRLNRWVVGISFLLLDAIIKWTCSEPVRQLLAGQLSE